MCARMEAQLKSLMDKPSPTNGFTMLEALFVLMIFTFTSYSLFHTPSDSLSIFARTIQMRCIQTQEQAFYNKETTTVLFGTHSAYFNEEEVDYPKGIVCDAMRFQYNADGNISKGGHVSCSNGSESVRFIFQIGAGRVRIEK